MPEYTQASLTHEQIPSNGIELHVVSAGPADGRPVILVHGFPELWYSWRYQLVALANAGYRAIALDQRGYGDSSAPKEITAYGSDQLTADLCGLLDHFGYDKADFVGHDWGAMVVWEMGRLHPERVSSIYNLSVPFSQSPAPPMEIFEVLFEGKFFYMLYFQDVGPPEAELEADPRHFLRTLIYAASAAGAGEGNSVFPDVPREGTGFLDILSPAPDVLPDWVTEADIDMYAAAFTKSGFFGPISFYRNMDANWQRSKDIPASVYAYPTGFLTGDLDAVRAMLPDSAQLMAAEFGDFRGETVISGAGHWVQQEKPAESNAAILAFLNSLD